MIDLPIFISIIGGLIGLLALGAILYWRLLNEQEKVSQHVEKLLRISETEKNWEEAEKKAHQLLETTKTQATAIITHASTLRQKIDEDLAKSMREAIAKEQDALKEMLTKLYGDVSVSIEKNLATLFLEAKKQMENEGRVVQQEMLAHTKQFTQKVTTLQGSIEADLLEYRRKRMTSIDKTMEKIATSLVRQAFTDSLSDEQQELLVMKALESAKKEGIFEANTTHTS